MGRQLKDKESVEARKRQYQQSDVLCEVDGENGEYTFRSKKPREDRIDEAKRWAINEQDLRPLPLPHSHLPDDPDTLPITLQDCMGFAEFDSTKGLHVFGNQDGPLPPKRKQRQYRQMLHVKQLYEIPLTKADLEAEESKK